jgi:transcriptional regulator GlxA family with amidase domain
MTDPRTVTTVLFDGFEPLDVFGPLELFGQLPDQFRLVLAGPDGAPVRSAHGTPVVTDVSYETAPSPDIVLVPGGRGARPLAKDPVFLAWLGRWAGDARLVTSVCTGSALLAAAGLLDGYRATSNKRAFAWACEQGPRTEWVAQARWVEDRDRWTSSGVAAGMDMALALIARMHGRPMAQETASRVELEWHSDDAWDPFAAENGLVPG